jgi:hypothetical protein
LQRRSRVAQRIEGGRVEAPERRGEKTHRRSREDGPDVHAVGALEASGLQQRTRDDIAKREESGGRRDDKEGHLPGTGRDASRERGRVDG